MKKIISVALLLVSVNVLAIPVANAQLAPNGPTTNGTVSCTFHSDGSAECTLTVKF